MPLFAKPGQGNRLLATLALLALLTGLASGCASSQPPVMTRYWTLEYPAPSFEGLQSLPAELRMNRFGAAHGYTGRDMVYSPSHLERGTYPYHYWLASPSDLLGDLLARDIRASRLFQAVRQSDELGPSRFALEGGVQEFLELNRESGWKARLVLHVMVLDQSAKDESKRVVLQRSYRMEEPIAQKGAYGLAQAMSRAAARTSRRLIIDLHQALSGRLN